MLKFLTHKLRTHSINEDNYIEKVDEDHDSGTESDDEIDDVEIPSLAVMSDPGSVSPADTGCSVGSPGPDLHDAHSSEEELEVINSSPLQAAQPEKRKWSALSSENDENNPRCGNMAVLEVSGFGSGSGSDDEVHAPVQFRTSPPLEALKLGRPGKTQRLQLEVSPRKRSRHTRHSHPQRPCLDFEKMQQMKARSVTAWRNSGDHGGELSVFCW